MEVQRKKALFFFLLIALFLTVYLSQLSLAIYIFLFSFACSHIFLFSFACSHSCSFSKLHCPQSHSLRLPFTLLFCTKWPNDIPFISSSFSSFLPFILLISIHNKCNLLTLTFVHNKDDFNSSTPLFGKLLQQVHFNFQTFVHDEEKLRLLEDKKDKLVIVYYKRAGPMVQCTQQLEHQPLSPN